MRSVVGEIVGDLRYAGRTLRRSPGFAVLAIAIMALGIGANTAVFSVVNGVLLKPLPYPGADRIVTLRTAFLARAAARVSSRSATSGIGVTRAPHSRRWARTALASSRHARDHRRVRVDGQRRCAVLPRLRGRAVDGPHVHSRGNRARHRATRGGDQPCVLAEPLRRCGRHPAADPPCRARVHPIVGVMPPGFQFPTEPRSGLPKHHDQTSRPGHSFFAVGRLKPQVSLERAQTELSAIAARLEQQYPESNKGRGVMAVRMQDELVGDVRYTLYLLWGVVGVVLLIACANTATLLLGKATTRTREIAVRAALGARRGRIVRQLITESLLLALVAGAAGTLLAYWGVRMLVALTPSDVVRLTDTGIDGSVLAFTVGVSLATSLLFGLVPALHASKVDVVDAIKQAGTRSVVGGRMVRARGILVVSEIALAVVLLTGAGLLIKSLVALHNTDLGFQPENVLVIKATGVRSREDNNLFFSRLVSRMADTAWRDRRWGDIEPAGRLFECRHRLAFRRSNARAAGSHA